MTRHLPSSQDLRGASAAPSEPPNFDPPPSGPPDREDALRRALHEHLIGQPDFADAVLPIYRRYLAGMNDPARPVGSVFMLGPTGVGKTRSAEIFARALQNRSGYEGALIRVDCGEFQHSHEIAKLIGSPPGYLGHRETHPVLTQEALTQWQTENCKLSFVLFDEIEKASDALWQLLLGILDRATLTLGDNRRVDFSNTIVFLTSNVGAHELAEHAEGTLGFAGAPPTVADRAETRRIALAAMRRKFPPEFINRLDGVVVYDRLTSAQLEQILLLELRKVETRGEETWVRQFRGDLPCLTLAPATRAALLREGSDPRYGARPLRRAVERLVGGAWAEMVLRGRRAPGRLGTALPRTFALGPWEIQPDGTLQRAGKAAVA